MDNKKILLIAIALIPLVVISFVFKRQETNFNLDEGEKHFDSHPTYTIKLLLDGTVKTLELEDYVTGVVAGEMPALFHEEALKAQAVAARTFALYKSSRTDKEYDLTSSTKQQVYLNTDAMRTKWGSDYDKYYQKIRHAVDETKGEVLTYRGDIIEAFYFAMSSGATNESSAVFGEKKDYLESVPSIYETSDLTGFTASKDYTIEEFKALLGLKCNTPAIEALERTESHYLTNIKICDKTFKGSAFREALSLRSADVDVSIEDKVRITTRGYGHGVGMSQYGANGYAKAGYDYTSILKHYYKNVEITDILDV